RQMCSPMRQKTQRLPWSLSMPVAMPIAMPIAARWVGAVRGERGHRLLLVGGGTAVAVTIPMAIPVAVPALGAVADAVIAEAQATYLRRIVEVATINQ